MANYDYEALRTSGDNSKDEKEIILDKFIHGDEQIIFGTKILSLGLDIDDVNLIIFYNYKPYLLVVSMIYFIVNKHLNFIIIFEDKKSKLKCIILIL